MAKHTNTVKSVVVKRKPLSLDVDSVVYTCDAFGSRGYVIRGTPEKTSFAYKLKVFCFDADHDFYIGKEDYLFLGDLGVPGYAYDDRPCSLFNNKLSAHAHGGKYFKWLNTSRYNEHSVTGRWLYD